MTGRILVTGASGQLGSRILHHLLATSGVEASAIVAGSRDPAKLTDLAQKGVETRRIDFDDAASLTEGFAGIDRLLIVSTDALDGAGTRLRQHLAAVEAARQAGVGRFFYTSMPGADDSLITFAPDHLGTEAAIKASGIAHTIFRNGWYMENLFMALPQALASGQWYSAAGDGKIAHIARDDIARDDHAAVLASPPAENVSATPLTGDNRRGTTRGESPPLGPRHDDAAYAAGRLVHVSDAEGWRRSWRHAGRSGAVHPDPGVVRRQHARRQDRHGDGRRQDAFRREPDIAQGFS